MEASQNCTWQRIHGPGIRRGADFSGVRSNAIGSTMRSSSLQAGIASEPSPILVNTLVKRVAKSVGEAIPLDGEDTSAFQPDPRLRVLPASSCLMRFVVDRFHERLFFIPCSLLWSSTNSSSRLCYGIDGVDELT